MSNFVKSFNIFGTEAIQITCITLHGYPDENTQGAIGIIGMDVDSQNKDLYKCVGIDENGYIWVKIDIPIKVSDLENDSGYVKNTDYATKTVGGVVKAPNSTVPGIVVSSGGTIQLYRADDSQIEAKTSFSVPITPSNVDYAIVKGTHQDMSNDYDVTTLKTISSVKNNEGQLPASYDAVKGYIDALKTDITTLEETSYTFEFANTHNTEIRLAEVSSISFTFGNGEYMPDYHSGLSFDSGATPTAIDYTDSGILNWVGTDCTMTSDGLSIFQPSANTHYDIVFYFNGVQFIGLVTGYVSSIEWQGALPTGNVVG